MARRLVFCTALIAAMTVACTSGGSGSPPTGVSATSAQPSSPSAGYSVTYAPAQFSADVTNPWFPLTPGTTLIYRGTKDEQPALEYFTISNETQKIDGVPCRVVLDRLFLRGTLAETTRDYYTQDNQGNVWYFGEDTAQLDPKGNLLGTEGTWHAHEAGAFPGIFMFADPRVGDSHRQEYYVGHAEDVFQVLALSTSVSVPYRSFTGALRTKEWTALEPDVLDNKYYVRGIGTVKEIAVKGPLEELVLIGIRRG
jgi:hypothetical protein